MMEAEAEDTNALRVMVEERERTLTNKLIAAVRQVQGCADCGVEPVGCNEGIGREGQCTACRITLHDIIVEIDPNKFTGTPCKACSRRDTKSAEFYHFTDYRCLTCGHSWRTDSGR